MGWIKDDVRAIVRSQHTAFRRVAGVLIYLLYLPLACITYSLAKLILTDPITKVLVKANFEIGFHKYYLIGLWRGWFPVTKQAYLIERFLFARGVVEYCHRIQEESQGR